MSSMSAARSDGLANDDAARSALVCSLVQSHRLVQSPRPARGGGPQLAESHLTRTPFRKILRRIFALIMPPVYCGYGTRWALRRLDSNRVRSVAHAVGP